MSAIDTEAVTAALRASWSAQTSSGWQPDNPARGQCNVTALVIQETFGGRLLQTPVDGVPHYYNEIDGRSLDLTVSQFHGAPPDYLDLPATRDAALAGTTSERYATMKSRFALALERNR